MQLQAECKEITEILLQVKSQIMHLGLDIQVANRT